MLSVYNSITTTMLRVTLPKMRFLFTLTVVKVMKTRSNGKSKAPTLVILRLVFSPLVATFVMLRTR